MPHRKDIATAALATSVPAFGTAATAAAGGNEITTALGLTLAEWSFVVTILVAILNGAYVAWKWRAERGDRRRAEREKLGRRCDEHESAGV
jgi:hypothetical protein